MLSTLQLHQRSLICSSAVLHGGLICHGVLVTLPECADGPLTADIRPESGV